MDTLLTPDPLLEEAKKTFGISYLFPYQRLAVHNILSACGAPGSAGADSAPGDQIIMLPTGAGKSLCFQLPAVLLSGLTVVVYPLLSLMADQERRLKGAGIPVRVLRGGQTSTEREKTWTDLGSGTAKFVVANPEVLAVPAVVKRFEGLTVDHLVVDEAHCVAEWGETFRPAYLGLGEVRRNLRPRVTTAFTATASPPILARVITHLYEGKTPHLIAGDPDRPNIHYRTLPSICKDRTLARLLSESGRPALVFCRSRNGAEFTARALRRRLGEEDIFFYHAGLSREEKKAREDWFLPSRGGILTSTCAFGMGVDKPDIRTVIHRDVPGSVEAYLQESGRAGRDREPSRAVLLYGPEDIVSLGSLADPFAKERAEALLDYARLRFCRREKLLSLLGWKAESCSGCDVCDGTIQTAPEGEQEILRFLRKNRRRYTQEEAALLLTGTRNYRSIIRGLTGRKEFGLLPSWNEEDLSEAMESLLGEKKIYLPPRFPWKGLLTVRGSHIFPNC
jgi:ATP-dependent DNA helicase RecQ